MVASGLLLTLVKKYAAKGALVLGVVLFLAGAAYMIIDDAYDRGEADTIKKYEKRDAETERKGRELLKLREHEIALDTAKKDQQYIGAIETYANYSIDLHRQLDANRLPNKPAKTNCNSNPVPRTTEDSGALVRASPETVQELEYLESLKAVELIIETICVPNAKVE
jgi:hypothetical protein